MQGRIKFNSIYDFVAAATETIEFVHSPTLEDILDADAQTREFVNSLA